MQPPRIVTRLAPRLQVTLLLLGPAILAVRPSVAPAQATCKSGGGFGREAVLTATSVAIVSAELAQMQRSTGWTTSDLATSVVVADPSSHLHAFGSYAIASGVAASARARCVSPMRAAWMGAAYSAAIGVAKEIADGYYEGFSSADLAVDGAGIALAVAPAYAPALRHVTPALSYDPRRRHVGGAGGLLTNYPAQTFWLSADVDSLFEAAGRSEWPRGLRVSLGRRAYQDHRTDEYVLGLDLSAAELTKGIRPLRTAAPFLRRVRLPGPALVLRDGRVRGVAIYW
ncbi:MAG: DUF2279 domain-containing protein [Gemmatimonadaceae bacterium]